MLARFYGDLPDGYGEPYYRNDPSDASKFPELYLLPIRLLDPFQLLSALSFSKHIRSIIPSYTMTRYSAFSLIAVIVLFVSVLPTAFASPTCVHRHGKNNCVQACKNRWGQPSGTGADPASHRHKSSASPPPQSSSKPSPSPHSTPKPPSKNSGSTPAPSPSPNTSGNKLTSGSDIDQYLSAHNSIRAQHGAADLTWSDTLASAAQKWADGCAFKHSGGSLGPYGGKH